MNKIKKLLEHILYEGLEDTYKKYYSDIDNGLFWKLVQLDPTYKGGDVAGNYVRWILNLWKNNRLKTEDFYKVTDYLKFFDKNKRLFQNKDVFQFKSLPDIANAIDIASRTEPELSSRQMQRELKKKGLEDAELVYENNDWEVWIPETYEASCTLGSGTRWCTATGNTRGYYDDYIEQGPLYVIISKKDPHEKYQFHFESRQFMDKNDRDIGWISFIAGNNLRDFFMPIIEKQDEEFFYEEFKDYFDDWVDRDELYLSNEFYGLNNIINDFNDTIKSLKEKLKKNTKDDKFIDYILPTYDNFNNTYKIPLNRKDISFQLPEFVDLSGGEDYFESEALQFIESLPKIAKIIVRKLVRVENILKGRKPMVIMNYLNKNKSEELQLNLFPEINDFIKDNLLDKLSELVNQAIFKATPFISDLNRIAERIHESDLAEYRENRIKEYAVENWKEYLY